MGNIADSLARAGHNVTMMMVVNDRDVHGSETKNVKHILHYSSPLVGEDEWSNLHFKKANIFHLRTFELSDYLKMENINLRICQGLLNDELFLSKLEGFDLLVLEMFHFCPAGIAHLTSIPKIILASALGMTTFHYEVTGLMSQITLCVLLCRALPFSPFAHFFFSLAFALYYSYVFRVHKTDI